MIETSRERRERRRRHLQAVPQLHAGLNDAYASCLHRFAERAAAERRPILGYLAVLVYSDGSIGSEFQQTYAYAPLIAATELVKRHIMDVWEQQT